MNKISIFVLLILVYLGISKSFSPSEKRTAYLSNELVFNNYFTGEPVSVILLDSLSSGFLIKTYHHKYKIVHAFKIPEIITVRTSKKFWNENLENHGMSLFRRKERTLETSTVIMPPGALFLGDPAYGTWELTNYGSKVWKFHRTYKNFPQIFGWGEFKPDLDFYQRMKIYQSNEKPFYGPKNEFGTQGTTRIKKKIKIQKQRVLPKVSTILKEYFQIPSWDEK